VKVEMMAVMSAVLLADLKVDEWVAKSVGGKER
jgi:hypothetical protein